MPAYRESSARGQRSRRDAPRSFRPGLPLILFGILMAILLVAGGASSAEVTGQAVVRGGSVLLLGVLLLLGDRPVFGTARTVLFFLIAMLALILAQLIPLPPDMWLALPGRAQLAEVVFVSGASVWRPLSLAPDATFNAAASLVVPFAALLLFVSMARRDREVVPGFLLAVAAISMLIGLAQFSGAWIDNPLINDRVGEVSGTFANRNHFALLMAWGCVLAPTWAFLGERDPSWRGPVALALMPLFALAILASGSRAGLLLGAIAIPASLMLVGRKLKALLDRRSRWLFPGFVSAGFAAMAILLLVSVLAGRAVALDRAFSMKVGEDMRARALPTVVSMVRDYFPAGAGFGSFDPVFRMHEPFGLLKMTYFNHAHNDFLEIVLDGGVVAALLLVVALGWWLYAAIRAWRARGTDAVTGLARLGSVMFGLLLVASLFDYPARTPMIMAIIAIFVSWLAAAGARARFTD